MPIDPADVEFSAFAGHGTGTKWPLAEFQRKAITNIIDLRARRLGGTDKE